MTGEQAERQDIEQDFLKCIEKNPQYRKKLEEWYKKEKSLRITIFWASVLFLLLSSFGQFGLLDYSFKERLDLTASDKILGFPIKTLLGLLVTAALPITTLIDDLGIFNQKIKIFFGWLNFSPIIWLLLPGDMLLTFQAVLVANQTTNPDRFLPFIAFTLAAIFSTSAFYLSKAIASAAKKFMVARRNLQIIKVYGINPIPLYKDAEQIKLIEENQAVREEAENTIESLAEVIEKHQEILEAQQDDFQNQRLDFEIQIRSLSEDYTQKLQERESETQKYKEYVDSLNQLSTNFNKVKKPISELMSKVKQLSGIDESIQALNFPKLPRNSTSSGKTVEIPKFYWRWQNSNRSWKNLQLPSELSPVAYTLLNFMEQQQELPPPTVRNYAPREGLKKCLLLDFDNYYAVIVFCRDEEYRKDGNKWDTQAQLDFKTLLTNYQNRGYSTLEFTPQEIMSNPSTVLQHIKNAIDSKNEWESN
ncbi:MAG: hypothetical protein WBF90_25360 [Rivularia sp. (in: cyanobacteria)]|jgi:hypothetical protein